MHTQVHLFVSDLFSVLGDMHRGVESLRCDGNSMFAASHSGRPILHPHQQWVRVPISPHPQHTIFPFIYF